MIYTMKLGMNVAIAVVLVLLLLTRPVVLSEMMHHGLVKAIMLCLVIITTVRETSLGVLAALVFVVLSENTHEGFSIENVADKIKKVTKKDKEDEDAKDEDAKDEDDDKKHEHDDKKVEHDK